mgnify:CR=1 FL=1
MSGGKQRSNSTQSTNNTLDPWSRNQWETVSDRITSGIDDFRSGIGAYDGPLISPMTASERRAGGIIDGATGAWRDDVAGLAAMLDGSNFSNMSPQTFADFNPDVYVNPYAEDMIGSVTGDIERATDRARTASTADTLTNGAYGGSRHGVRDALLDETMLQQIADSSAGIRFDTWNAGADNFYRDVANDMSATGYNNDLQLTRTRGLADLLDLGRTYEQQDIDRLMGFGATERSISDRDNAARYADYNRVREELMRALGLDFAQLESIPMIVDSTGESSTTTRTNPGALGIAGTLLSGASSMFGSGGMFGAGGMFGPSR